MGHPLRYHPPGAYFEITARTIHGALYLRPSRELNRRIEAVIARAQKLYGVEIVAYNVMGNHYHLLGRAKGLAARTAFIRHINRGIGTAAREVNGVDGPIWEGRPKIRIVLDEVALTQRVRYICSNGVKEGLVETPTEWPGATAARALVTQRDVVAMWLPAAARHALAQGKHVEGEVNVLRLSPLPSLAGTSEMERQRYFARMFASIAEEGRAKRAGRPAMGIDALLRQNPRTRIPLERRGAPAAFTTVPALREQFRRDLAIHHTEYRGAAGRLAAGELTARFPHGSRPPPGPFVPHPTR